MKIYFVDEDVSQMETWADILEMRGLETQIFRDADLAFNALCECTDAQLVFIDVMLAAASPSVGSRFPKGRTDDYLSTGLALLEDLAVQNPAVFPRRSVLLSHTGHKRILAKIDEACRQHGIPCWRKGSFNDPYDFATKTERHLQTLPGSSELE